MDTAKNILKQYCRFLFLYIPYFCFVRFCCTSREFVSRENFVDRLDVKGLRHHVVRALHECYPPFQALKTSPRSLNYTESFKKVLHAQCVAYWHIVSYLSFQKYFNSLDFPLSGYSYPTLQGLFFNDYFLMRSLKNNPWRVIFLLTAKKLCVLV